MIIFPNFQFLNFGFFFSPVPRFRAAAAGAGHGGSVLSSSLLCHSPAPPSKMLRNAARNAVAAGARVARRRQVVVMVGWLGCLCIPEPPAADALAPPHCSALRSTRTVVTDAAAAVVTQGATNHAPLYPSCEIAHPRVCFCRLAHLGTRRPRRCDRGRRCVRLGASGCAACGEHILVLRSAGGEERGRTCRMMRREELGSAANVWAHSR